MKKLSFLLILSLYFMAIATGVNGADTAAVTATVTPQSISVSVSDGAIAFGTVSLGGTQDTITLTDTQTVKNTGNVMEDFNIKTSTATGGTTPWTVSTTTAGADSFVLSVSDDAGVGWEIIESDYITMSMEIEAAGEEPYDFKIDMPTSSTDSDEKSITITIQAVENTP